MSMFLARAVKGNLRASRDCTYQGYSPYPEQQRHVDHQHQGSDRQVDQRVRQNCRPGVLPVAIRFGAQYSTTPRARKVEPRITRSALRNSFNNGLDMSAPTDIKGIGLRDRVNYEPATIAQENRGDSVFCRTGAVGPRARLGHSCVISNNKSLQILESWRLLLLLGRSNRGIRALALSPCAADRAPADAAAD